MVTDEFTLPDHTEEAFLKQAAKPGGNIGCHLRDQFLVVDIDDKEGRPGKADWLEIRNKTAIPERKPSTKMPIGGYHLWFRIPEERRGITIKPRVKEYPGIDFLSGNVSVSVPGCERKPTKKKPTGGVYIPKEGWRDFPEAPAALLDLIEYRFTLTEPKTQDYEDGIVFRCLTVFI